MNRANQYRTHWCSQISEELIGGQVRIAGWVQNIRDHGGILFLDVRDERAMVQVVLHEEEQLQGVHRQCALTLSGTVRRRDEQTINPQIATGTVEIVCEQLHVVGPVHKPLPFDPALSRKTREEVRLKYRFLDLRNEKMQANIRLRGQVISHLRQKMEQLGFLDIQTPLLTASSPEGARDYLIPSRKHEGAFYALPQAPQIFKQLLMASGFERYYQIAPCFRDEDARADRSPGEFYQLDFEMAFAGQEDVLAVAERVIADTFAAFAPAGTGISAPPFVRIPYRQAMLRYGSDKPDLRNPLEIVEISDLFQNSAFAPFCGKSVRAIGVPACADKPRKFFEEMLAFALHIGMKGLGYVKVNDQMAFQGPIDKFLCEEDRRELIRRAGLKPGSVCYFIADSAKRAPLLAGQIRSELGRRLKLIEKNAYRFCFITDFPMYERDEHSGKPAFTHNPFSLPQGGLEALEQKDPYDILAYQYDLVVNGVELASGAVRNHDLPTMIKAFALAGYSKADIVNKFPALYSAFSYGAPPHAGMAPGIDRMIMLLSGEESIREVTAFPMNANAEDVLMGAPSPVGLEQLREVHIKVR